MSIFKYDPKTSQFLGEFNTIKEAATDTQCSHKSIVECLQGIRKSIKGVTFMVNPNNQAAKTDGTDWSSLKYLTKKQRQTTYRNKEQKELSDAN